LAGSRPRLLVSHGTAPLLRTRRPTVRGLHEHRRRAQIQAPPPAWPPTRVVTRALRPQREHRDATPGFGRTRAASYFRSARRAPAPTDSITVCSTPRFPSFRGGRTVESLVAEREGGQAVAFWRASSKIRSASRSQSAHGMGKRSTSSCTAPGRRGAPRSDRTLPRRALPFGFQLYNGPSAPGAPNTSRRFRHQTTTRVSRFRWRCRSGFVWRCRGWPSPSFPDSSILVGVSAGHGWFGSCLVL